MRLIMVFLCLLTTTASAQAQTPPMPPKKVDLDQKLESSKAEKKALEHGLKKIKQDLDTTKDSLIQTAKRIQKNERSLQELDLKIAELEDEKLALSAKLHTDRGAISRLILALERIRRLPPEALIVRPDSPLKTAQSAMLLEEILPALNKQATDLKFTLEELQAVSKNLQTKRATVVATSKNLNVQQRELNSMIKKRTQLYSSTQKDLAAKQKKIASISARAKNLSDLVKRLDDERTRSQNKTASSAKERVVGEKPPKPGAPRLPLPGIIRTGFNEPDNFGAPSKGLDIEGRAGALVVAPMGGIVRFSGYFKNYGNMVILEHQKGWHSLIAGLENIDTVVGQSVGAGEPLGVLHKSSTGQKPVLYYELRHKGKAVNPAKKFGDLS